MPHPRLFTPPATRHGPPPPGLFGVAPAAARLSDAQADWLRARLRGALLLPGDAQYAPERFVFNKRYRPTPLAIANVRDADDLATCLDFVRRERVPFRLRAGGHNFAGYSAGPGLVIDLTLLDAITLDPDPDRRGAVLVVGGGCPQGRLGQMLTAAGWELPLGNWPSVAIGGFMQGGGYGLAARASGLNLDHVVAAEVMLADGRVVTASAARNRDLFWALRGGTGNLFGVVLRLRYRLAPRVAHAEAELAWPLTTAAERARAAQVLLAVQHGFTTGAANPETSITCMGLCGRPEDGPGRLGPFLVVDVDHAGPAAAMEAAIAPLLALPGRLTDFDFAGLNRGSTIPPLQRASRYVARALTPGEWQAVLDQFVTAPDPLDTLYLQALGGRLNAVGREETAFIHRDAAFLAYTDVFWRDAAGERAGLRWQQDWGRMMAPLGNGHSYQNFADPSLADYRHAYWGEAWPMLAAIKRKYDPGELFRLPQTVAGPAPAPHWPAAILAALAEPIDVGPDAGDG